MLYSRLLCTSTLAFSIFISHARKLLKDELLLVAYFRGNGENGLATSPDGSQWMALDGAGLRPVPTIHRPLAGTLTNISKPLYDVY